MLVITRGYSPRKFSRRVKPRHLEPNAFVQEAVAIALVKFAYQERAPWKTASDGACHVTIAGLVNVYKKTMENHHAMKMGKF